ncbi:hypothetical protein [Candidatus Palauibacter polyketidifaciens]|uniref:hypothetical protein n=1 Tax=Candidatus Palauibacter polyketidifaciens TaxID=3056740 RepID=UPI0023862A32|nr:hypothetical protein [Candidatus Palauibacter polyketidifaciens]MDE2720091.1 hypothetical protein [Candidatus Palauibacter polyketidifaciens]
MLKRAKMAALAAMIAVASLAVPVPHAPTGPAQVVAEESALKVFLIPPFGFICFWSCGDNLLCCRIVIE